MAQKLTASMPENFDIAAQFDVQLTAVDPTSGAVVAGVLVSNVAIMAAPVTPDTDDSSAAVLPSLFIPIDIQPTG